MSNKQNINLIFSALLLIAGVWLFSIAPENGMVEHFEEGNGSVTIIDISKKDKTNYQKWIGGGLIVLSIGLFFFNNLKKETNLEPPLSYESNKLTLREKEIANLILQEKLTKEIADELHISVSTVKSHINSIYKKMDVKTREELRDVLNNQGV